MKRRIKYCDRILEVFSYNIKTEKELLFYSYEENKNIDDILYILKDNFKINIDYSKLFLEEKFFIAYKIREISVSSSLNIKFKCTNSECNHIFDDEIQIGDIFVCSKLSEQYNDIISDNINDYFKENIEELTTQEYDEKVKYIRENAPKFDFNLKVNCLNCNKEHIINLCDLELLCKSFSESGLQHLYKSINQLIYKGNYQLNGILNDMLPFEREIYISELNKEIEEQNKQRKEEAIKSNYRKF